MIVIPMMIMHGYDDGGDLSSCTYKSLLCTKSSIFRAMYALMRMFPTSPTPSTNLSATLPKRSFHVSPPWMLLQPRATCSVPEQHPGQRPQGPQAPRGHPPRYLHRQASGDPSLPCHHARRHRHGERWTG